MKLEVINPNEDPGKTMEYIANREFYKVENPELSECKIYQRGQYVLVEHQGIVRYWEMTDTKYPFLKMAIDFMELDKPAKWKTLHRLISLRMGIRQTEVNLCGYVDAVLQQEGRISLNRYNHFMRLARAHDILHHGSRTF